MIVCCPCAGTTPLLDGEIVAQGYPDSLALQLTETELPVLFSVIVLAGGAVLVGQSVVDDAEVGEIENTITGVGVGATVGRGVAVVPGWATIPGLVAPDLVVAVGLGAAVGVGASTALGVAVAAARVEPGATDAVVAPPGTSTRLPTLALQ